jgi:hypothetical protein
MTTDNYFCQDDQMSDLFSLAEAHSLSALEQSARYAAQLAIARWINASAISTMPLVAPAPAARAAWYAQAQQNFQEWLGSGGFAQYDTCCADLAEQIGQSAPKTKPLPGNGTLPIDTCID